MIFKNKLFLFKLAIFILISILAFQFVYSPWQLNWGATDEEIGRSMVGDELVKNPTFNATRAITIEAHPHQIWPWLIQMGYQKAGFYSYDFLDNKKVPSADQIISKYQNLKVGDSIPLSKNSFMVVDTLIPDKHMLWVHRHQNYPILTWEWDLDESNEQNTRLVSRLRIRLGSYRSRIMWNTFEIVMMRKCLLGIKHRSESWNNKHKGEEL